MTMLPAMKALVDAMNAAGGAPDFATIGPLAGREHAAAAGGRIPAGPASVSTEDFAYPAADGVGVHARLYRPETPAHGLVVFFHGGGWVLNSVAEYDAVCRHLAVNSRCAVLSADYRRAPEHPFPTPLEDCYAATVWAAAQAPTWVGRAAPIAVAGDSAGGNLAAAVALLAKARGGPSLAAQCLIYPCTDADFSRSSYNVFGTGAMLTASSMRWFWDQYVPTASDRTNPFASPLRAPDLSGLPRTMVEIAEYDPVRDEGEAYAEALGRAGVATSMRRWYGLCHGFFQLAPLIPPAMSAVRQIARDLGLLLETQ
jgi:acetyl esterase